MQNTPKTPADKFEKAARGEAGVKWLLASLALLTTACDNRPDQWDAFVYPNRNDLSKA